MKALFVVSGNPLLSSSNSERFQQALEQLELLVSIEIIQNETADFADYVLPGTHFAERPDIPFLFNSLCGTSCTPWFQYVDALAEPPGEARDEIWILHQLANACDAPLFGSKVFQALLNTGAAMKKLPLIGSLLPDMKSLLLGILSRIGKQGSLNALRKYPHGKLREALQNNNYLGKRVINEGGKVQLAPAEFIALAEERLEKSFAFHRKTQGELKLITKRERFSHNTWTHNHPKYISKDRQQNYIYIHPEDAASRNIENLDTVVVTSKAGSVTVKAKLDNKLMRGTVALPHGWGHTKSAGQSVAKTTEGVNANILASDGTESIEPLSGMTQFNGITVDVSLMENTAEKAVESA